MKIFEIINTANLVQEFTNKDITLPYALRRGLKKNIATFVEEYKTFDEERNKILEDTSLSIDEQNAKIQEILETDIQVDLVKLPENILENVDMSLKDEAILSFMLIPEE